MKDFLDYCSKMYYEGVPVISDAEFDTLSSHFGYRTVGYQVTDGIEHYFPMYSLQNIWDLSEAKIPLAKCIQTPKLDGAAVSCLYVGGQFALGLTRGDGKIGRDITDKMECLVPPDINMKGVVQITGEVVCHKNVKNARNVAAGALGLKDVEEFQSRNLEFVAYDMIMEKQPWDSWSETMQYLQAMTFLTVIDTNLNRFPTDGLVFRLDSYKEFKAQGATSKFPKGAVALKEKKEGVHTTLLDVDWQVGKSGIVSPVAILEPVEIGGAMVSRATLHNIEYIEGLDLEIGCTVSVIRSGEIIPRIVGRV